MKTERRIVRLLPVVAALLAVGLRTTEPAAATEDERDTELRLIKARLEQLEKKAARQDELERRVREQDELIRKLSAEKGLAVPPPATATTSARASATTTATPAAQAPPADDAQLEQRVTESVLRKVQPSLAAANKTFASQFNPAIGLFLDNVLSWSHDHEADFEFRSAELGLSASIDPFARGYAVLNGSEDDFEVEEAAIVTTSLPWNLTVKGGRFFADFGRLSTRHDHDLPFVNRPGVLDSFVGGESRADGLEVNWLAPTSHYFTLTVGAYDKIGSDNPRVDSSVPRSFDRFSYLVRPATSFNLGDSSMVDLGASFAWTPEVADYHDDGRRVLAGNRARYLAGADVTYRYTPLNQSIYHGVVWGTEVLYNNESRNLADDLSPDFERIDAWGLYSYVEAKLTRRFYPGFLFDWYQAPDGSRGNTADYSPYLTIWPSEFQRIRLQYTHLDEPHDDDDQVFLQWTAILGSHVHSFQDR